MRSIFCSKYFPAGLEQENSVGNQAVPAAGQAVLRSASFSPSSGTRPVRQFLPCPVLSDPLPRAWRARGIPTRDQGCRHRLRPQTRRGGSRSCARGAATLPPTRAARLASDQAVAGVARLCLPNSACPRCPPRCPPARTARRCRALPGGSAQSLHQDQTAGLARNPNTVSPPPLAQLGSKSPPLSFA